jgi:hypothetical protein
VQEISEIAQIYVLSRYHHQLKSKWLGGKRNQRIDHLLHALIADMLPDYVARYDSQMLGFKGPDLAEKRWEQIRARAPEMNAVSIHDLGGDLFSVESATDSTRKYLVDLGKLSCDCPDWPKVRLCKHVAAVSHFHGKQVGAAEVVLPKTPPPNPPNPEASDTRGDAGAATASILQNVISVSKDALIDGVPSSTETVRSLRVVEAHLTAVVRSTRSTESPLPEKEEIPPNQRGSMWADTAKRMGATQGRKRPRPSTPEPPATARIGELNRKQARIKFTDPYSGGVSSGRAAAPDARSAAKNAETRARAAAAASGAGIPQPLNTLPSVRHHPPSALPPAAWSTGLPSAPTAWRPIPAPFPPTYPYWPYTYFPPSRT